MTRTTAPHPADNTGTIDPTLLDDLTPPSPPVSQMVRTAHHFGVAEGRAMAWRSAYRAGWRWGALDGFFAGSVTVFVLIMAGSSWGWW